MRRSLFALALCFFAAHAVASEEGIRIETIVPASLDEVWNAWTTVDGVKSFFAGGANIDLRPDGAYEIYFDPSAAEGHRGADGMRVLLVQPKSALAFTWNAPAKFPEARRNRTHVMVRFQALSAKETKVVLTHDGFGEGSDWDAVRAYFQSAWGEVVLPRLVARFRSAAAPAPAF
jgi:uncharacterized protein YndB with AHSA1/START domain